MPSLGFASQNRAVNLLNQTRTAPKRAQGLAWLVSVNVGVPRKVSWNGGEVITGIFKERVTGRVILRRFHLDGDRQADLTVHGTDKAV